VSSGVNYTPLSCLRLLHLKYLSHVPREQGKHHRLIGNAFTKRMIRMGGQHSNGAPLAAQLCLPLRLDFHPFF
jgi:hypothetical protein